MLEGVLFDFDGVVVQSERLHMRTFLELLSPYGVSVDEVRWYKEFAGTGSKHIFEVLLKEYGIVEDADTLVEKRKKAYEDRVRAGELKETPGVRSFLGALRSKKTKIAIVSGSHRTNVRAALETLHLGEFDIIISGDEMKERKPDPMPYLQAAKMLSIHPAGCVVIEDSVAGCEAARRALMKLIVMESPALPYVGKYDLAIRDFIGLDYENVARLFR
jgi:beta-phosphoglucomutase